MKRILFTKNDCPICQWIKDNLDLSSVEVWKMDEFEGTALGLLAFYECVAHAQKNLPILVIENYPLYSFDVVVDPREIALTLGADPKSSLWEECKRNACAM